MRICILTFGTRGDVQPYVALGRGLQAAGHAVTLATVAEFETLVQEYGLQFALLRGDFLKAAQGGGTGNPLKLMRQYIAMARDTLDDEWLCAQAADVLIYNSAALGGEHLAEKLGRPAFASFPVPLYTPTRAFPSPFLSAGSLGIFNYASHQLFAQISPALYRGPTRQWRQAVLGLPPKPARQRRPIPTLYAYSSAVIPRPADWGADAVVTGYWFLEPPAGWQPPSALVEFLQAGPPPVYVGFGSMFMQAGAQLTDLVLQALRLAGQRAVLASGWGGLTLDQAPNGVYLLDAVPHAWLFPHMAAIVHHGGAGTTGAALRAGQPTVICPFIGDQPFWGRRVAALGVGPAPVPRGRLTPERLAAAIRLAVSDPDIRRRAAELGQTIRREDGVGSAVAFIQRRLADHGG